MALATARARTPNKRKGRTAGTTRPFHGIHNNGTDTDTLSHLRRQYLAAFGMSDLRARLVAGMAWERGA